jgi:hypothetical protein
MFNALLLCILSPRDNNLTVSGVFAGNVFYVGCARLNEGRTATASAAGVLIGAGIDAATSAATAVVSAATTTAACSTAVPATAGSANARCAPQAKITVTRISERSSSELSPVILGTALTSLATAAAALVTVCTGTSDAAAADAAGSSAVATVHDARTAATTAGHDDAIAQSVATFAKIGRTAAAPAVTVSGEASARATTVIAGGSAAFTADINVEHFTRRHGNGRLYRTTLSTAFAAARTGRTYDELHYTFGDFEGLLISHIGKGLRLAGGAERLNCRALRAGGIGDERLT